MKTLKLFLFIIQSIFLGLLVAAGYMLWQADFDPEIIATYIPKTQDKVKTAPIRTLNYGPFSYADAVKSSSASVVTIYTSKKVKQKIHPLLEDPVFSQLFGEQIKKLKREKTETNLGSGVIMTHSGYILTNQHVIDGADEILISLPDGRSSEAELIGQDRESDIAVLHIPLKSLQNIQIANNKDTVQVGDIALAIGNPLNVGQTVTMGIISATGRNRVGLNTFENFIQTDAAINPGNSGGALINAKGDLIGINTAMFSQSGGSQGIGFAIPATLAVNIMQEIIDTGRVSRGWLGVEGTEITAKAAMASGNPSIRGVLVVGVFIDSPADLAGVQTGDIITAINNKEVFRVRNVLENIAGHKPGDKITISLLRNGEPLDLSLTTTERPQ
ncbi:MAG: PDZ domain-containing protein [Gammaproteobacteria bacterium]|jgi:serine protease DegS|nr:PDZ domain-containing protein [Gammaproteobacteria bacterium]MBT3725046.1 PDZ domain-containing protein [Gammaproteobacteria bacterium]MBT4076310.1 PDZ domain-containing protein [Gammaproteobacteria bacterium]MBT4194790.1 PDZ domain-containing protein [Gammaproteobacteria bacterium]MBT4450761.1 PDZ domain-containing protein [Gammaproteobacteria bacterium]